MATREELDILLRAQDQTRAAFEAVQKSNDKLAEQVDRLNRNVSAAGEQAVATGAKFGVGFEAATRAVEKVINVAVQCARAIGKLAERAEQIQNKAAISGFSTDSVQALERLSTNAGVSSDLVFRAISRMQRAAVDGKKGFTDLGLESTRFLESLPEDQLRAVAERIMALPTAAERSAAAMALFGRSGAELLPILDDIAKGSEELQVSLSEGQVAALANLDDSLDRVKGAFSDFGDQLLATIATSPDAAQAINDIATAVSWLASQIKQNQAGLEIYVALLARAAGLAGPNSPLGALRIAGIFAEQGPTPKTPTGFGMEAPSGVPAGPSIAEQYAEKAFFAQLARDDKRAASARKLQAELDRLEQRQIDGAMRVEAAELGSLDRLDKADAAFTMNRMKNEERLIAAERAAVDAQIRAEEILTARMNAEEARRLADAERAAQQKREAIARLINEVGVLFEQLGVSADSNLGKAIGGFQDMGNAALGVQDVMTQLAQGNLWGAIAAGVGVVSMAVSGLKKLWDSIFGKSEIEKINDTRDAFISAHGGWLALQQEIAQATDEDLLKKLFDADTVEEYEAAIREIEEALAKLSATKVDPIHVPVVYDDPGYEGGGGSGEGEHVPGMARGGIVLPFVPRAAQGIVAARSPGGQLIRAGEREAELVAPVRAILENAARIGVAAAGRQAIELHVHLDGREIFASVEDRYRRGGGSSKRRG